MISGFRLWKTFLFLSCGPGDTLKKKYTFAFKLESLWEIESNGYHYKCRDCHDKRSWGILVHATKILSLMDFVVQTCKKLTCYFWICPILDLPKKKKIIIVRQGFWWRDFWKSWQAIVVYFNQRVLPNLFAVKKFVFASFPHF